MQKVIFLLCTLFYIDSFCQVAERPDMDMNKDYVTEGNDTLYISSLESISVTAPRIFENQEEYRRYLLYRRYAAKVYPYAIKAIKIHNNVLDETEEMKKRKRKKHARKVHKELKEEFMDPLKKLTKTQGKILVKMIERELDIPMYLLIKRLRGGTTASYWNTMSRLYGYKLKDKYNPGEDIILDSVLEDFDISL